MVRDYGVIMAKNVYATARYKQVSHDETCILSKPTWFFCGCSISTSSLKR